MVYSSNVSMLTVFRGGFHSMARNADSVCVSPALAQWHEVVDFKGAVNTT